MSIDDTTTARWTIDAPRSEEVPRLRRLRVRIERGEIDVIGRDEPGATVDVREVSGRALRMELADGLLQIGSSSDGGTRAAVTVAVQRGAEVDVEVVSAEVLVSGVKAGFRVRTVSGGVVCDATGGHAILEGTSGELALREHEGPVDVTTVSGSTTASGSISRLRCDAVSADLFLDLDVPDRVDVRTVSGAVVLRLGPDRPAEYAVDTVSGGIEVDGRDVGRGGFRGRWGAMDAEPSRVRLETLSGTVRVVHSGAV